MKRRLLKGISVLLLLLIWAQPAYAKTSIDSGVISEVSDMVSPNGLIGIRSSLYISSYGISLSAQSGGTMNLYYEVTGTAIMDKIGVSCVVVQEYRSGSWVTVITLSEDYFYDEFNYMASGSFTGISGRYYRATAYYYAEDNGGSDTRVKTSSYVMAQ